MTIHGSHWGAFRPRVEGGRLVEAVPFEGDTDPSPLLRSMPGAVHARNRVTRPAVRGSWLDGSGGRRGADPFVEVSWETALDLVAGELRRVHAEHGPEAVFGGSYGWSSAGRLHHAKTQLNHFLACAGGYSGQVSNYSYGAAERLLPHVLGDTSPVTGQVATWDDIAAHTDTVLMLGGFPAKNVQLESGGTGDHTARLGLAQALARGTRVVNVNPVRSDAPDHPGVDWVPVRPGSDTALLLALMRRLDVLGRRRRGVRGAVHRRRRPPARLPARGRRRGRQDAGLGRGAHRRARRDDRGSRRPAAHGAHPRHGDLGAAAGRARRAALLGGRRPRRLPRADRPARRRVRVRVRLRRPLRRDVPDVRDAGVHRALQRVPRPGPRRAPDRHAA